MLAYCTVVPYTVIEMMALAVIEETKDPASNRKQFIIKTSASSMLHKLWLTFSFFCRIVPLYNLIRIAPTYPPFVIRSC